MNQFSTKLPPQGRAIIDGDGHLWTGSYTPRQESFSQALDTTIALIRLSIRSDRDGIKRTGAFAHTASNTGSITQLDGTGLLIQ